MSDSPSPRLLSPDHGIDAAQDTYPDSVAAVFRGLQYAVHTEGPASMEHLRLAARTVDALDEVAEWADEGHSADPTACAWLSYLRWARAAGARPPAGSPVPPSREFDRDFPLLGAASRCTGNSFPALATGEFGEVARPIDPEAQSGEVLTRSIPYGLVPNLGWKALVPIVVDSAAITHGHAEAQTAAAGAALAVHASVRARETGADLHGVLNAVLAVCSTMTRPAPRTRALLTAASEITTPDGLFDADGALSRALGDSTDASSALALGLAATHVAEAEEATDGTLPSDVLERALELVSTHPATSPAARAVAAAVPAARWGTRAVPHEDDAETAEWDALARQWNGLWRPR